MSRAGRRNAVPRTLQRRRAAVASLARWATLAFVAPLAAGCGFQLRGSASLPFRTIHASFPPAASGTRIEFLRMLNASGDTRAIERPGDADVRLEVLSETREKEILGFSSTGRPREFQLRLRFGFRVVARDGTEYVPYTEIVLRRDLTTTDTQLVAKEQEEAMLYRDMQSDLVQQLMRRLAAIRPR